MADHEGPVHVDCWPQSFFHLMKLQIQQQKRGSMEADISEGCTSRESNIIKDVNNNNNQIY